MSTCSGNVITDWKRLWTLVSGIHHETPEQTVCDELLNVSKELQDGLLQFRPISASNTKLENLLQEKKQEKLLPFTQRLQELLDLESKQCWEILCYYLTNEYRGSASSLTALISTESNMTKLLDDIWGYYSLERIIVLKIVKNLLVFYNVANHPYQREYKMLVDKISLEKLRDSYLKQLEHLINEAPPSKLIAGEFFNYHAKLVIWSERNAREITEILHILLLICEHLPVDLAQVQQLFACFRQHSFGKQQRYLDASAHAELLARLAYSEVMLCLKCFDQAAASADSTSLARDIVAALGKDVTRMYHNPENGPLLFAWMLLSLRCRSATPEAGEDDEQALRRCHQFGKRAVHLNCFGYLHKLLSHVMFKDDSLVSRIARKTVYNLLTYMCDFFDGDGSCAAHPSIYELLCELLSWPTLAKEFCSNEEGGVRSLYNTLLEVFPVEFVHLSMLADALTKAGLGNYIKAQLESLPILTDLYDDSKYALRATTTVNVAADEYVLTQSVRPFARIDFTLPAGTTAAVMSRDNGYCVHFRATVNYFNVLQNEINCLLAEAHQGDFRGSERVRRVDAGLRYLDSALQRTKTLSGISVEMVHPTEMCIDILNKFKTVQCPPVELLANCLNVCTALLPLVDTEIFKRVINLGVLPAITNDTLGDFKKYAHGVCFDSRLVGSYLVDVEKKLERYDFLLAYLRFLRTYTKMQRNRYFEVEIPGLVFLLREVFPHMHSWRFKSQADRNKIYADIMGFICEILDAVTIVGDKDSTTATTSKEFAQKQLLRDICVYTLLSLENGLVLLRFVALGNAYLQHTMEMESNWMLQQPHGLVFLVRLAMRILMQLLRLKPAIFTSAAATELTPLEALIYTQPKQRDTLRIIPVVTSYMSNIFDRWLPILSCRLLKRIALEFNMSLLACLDMEPDQIRLTFLQKLPDELESDSLKIAVLELVEACIEKQPGVTEAFFKVNYTQEKRLFGKDDTSQSSQIADSILTFVEDYLEAVAKEPKTVEHVLPSKIMNLFHSLWKQNMQILVDELVQKPNFWTQLCNPLFSELRPQLRVYTQLLNILAIEIYCTRGTHKGNNEELKRVVLKFFEPEYFDKWLDYVFDMPKMPAILPLANESPIGDEMPEWLCRLQAFKDFLLIVLKKQPQFVDIPQRQLKTLAAKCLCVLVDRSQYVEDLRPFILLTEMYLFIILSFKHAYTESPAEDREMMHQLLQLLSRVASCYEDLHQRAKEACLSITIKSAELLADELLQDSTVALSFLHSVVSIICSELQNLENCVKAELQKPTVLEGGVVECGSSNSLILSLNLLKTIATIFHNDGPGNWDWPFITNKVFQRLLSCTGAILPLYSKQPLSVELLDVLIVFAKGNCSAEFLHCDVGDYLWLRLLPPKELLQASYTLSKPRSDDWTIVQKWWPIYARGIELVTILFQKHSNHFLKEVLQFVGIHEEYLIDSLQLGKQSLEPLAMNLIKSAITLIAVLVEFEKQWRLEHSQSLFNLMRSVQMLLGHSISMFHQPRNLKCLVAGRRSQLDILRDSENAGLVDEVITAFNDLTEIIILSVKCLQRFSPELIDLVCAPEFHANKWEPIFEIHFGAPKMTENAITLTFGTVLSIVGVYTKVLNLQNYGFHEVPLNALPTIEPGNDAATPATNKPSQFVALAAPQNTSATLSVSTSQRPFSKSLSVTSVSSSANCPPNELLSNLDGDLCLMALEHILTLAASQSMLALKNSQLPPREKQLIRREISTELLSYHEFVRKKVLSGSGFDYRSGELKEIWHRRKHGQLMMQPTNHGAESASSGVGGGGGGAQTLSSSAQSRHSITETRNSMRVNVVRRQHLQQQRTPATGPFEMSQFISPIVGLVRSQEPNFQAAEVEVAGTATTSASTPHFARAPLRRHADEQMQHTKRVYFSDQDAQDMDEVETNADQNNDDDIEYLPPEEPKYSPLSYVQLVEEDYLHFMSNLFSVICQND